MASAPVTPFQHHSAELNADYKISLKGTASALDVSESLESPLAALYVDVLAFPVAKLTFISLATIKERSRGSCSIRRVNVR